MMECPEYFFLDGTMYRTTLIEWLRVDGGGAGYGCWGEIKLHGFDESWTIGDGSYAGCNRHTRHKVASDFGFPILRAILRYQKWVAEEVSRASLPEGY